MLKDIDSSVNVASLKSARGSCCLERSSNYTCFVLDGSIIIGNAIVASNFAQGITLLAHMLLGHLSKQGITELSQRELLSGQSTYTSELYDCRIYGRRASFSFPMAIHKTGHFGACLLGPLEYFLDSLYGGASYILIFIYDFSCRLWAHSPKGKLEGNVFDYFHSDCKCGS